MKRKIFHSAILVFVLLLAGCVQETSPSEGEVLSKISEKDSTHTSSSAANSPTQDDQSIHDSSSEENTEQQEGQLYGVIIDSNDEQVTVSEIGLNGEGDIYLSQNDLSRNPSAYETGSVLLVQFDGSIQESYPAQFGQVISVSELTEEQLLHAKEAQWAAPEEEGTANTYVIIMEPRKNTGLRIGQILMSQGGPNGNILINASDFGDSLTEYQTGDLIRLNYQGSKSTSNSRSIEKATAIQKF